MTQVKGIDGKWYEAIVSVDARGRTNSIDNLDPAIAYAIKEIASTYGDVVSVHEKAKPLLKFGKNTDLDQNVRETVWSHGGNETYLTTNAIDTLATTADSDAGKQIRLEYHTIAGDSANEVFTFGIASYTLDSSGAQVAITPCARTSRMFNNSSSDLAGAISAFENTTSPGGVPSDASKVHIEIPAGNQSSFKAATTFSNNDYFILRTIDCSVNKKTGSASVDFYLETKAPGKTFRERYSTTASSGSGETEVFLDPPLIIAKNNDIRIRAESNTANVSVNASFNGYIAVIVYD